MVKESVIEFCEDSFNEVFRSYTAYRKSYGLLTANMCSLPIVKRGFIVSGEIPQEQISYLNTKYGEIIMCRTDAPSTSWYHIPRGRDLSINCLNQHYKYMTNFSTAKIILLCFEHPSIYFTGKYIERWNISGGVNVLLIWGEKLIIEYVGKGFDVGDITRGIVSPHQRIVIPWQIIRYDTAFIWKAASKWYVNEKQYCDTRAARLKALEKLHIIKEQADMSIPYCYTPVSYDDFQRLYSNCVTPVLDKRKVFQEDKMISILVNRYNETFHVFEIWEHP